MNKLYPSIKELQSFVVTAKHLSFTKAALELFITQGAVSRQIASLEVFLGLQLFLRQNNELVLTEAGKYYLDNVQRALQTLLNASNDLSVYQNAKSYLNVSIPPTLATHWLLPLIPAFYAKHPDITLNFLQYEHSHNFYENEVIDIAIQFGEGEWPGTKSEYLLGKNTSVICTSEYAKLHNLSDINNFQYITLLQHTNIPHAWGQWFTNKQSKFDRTHQGPKFDQFSLIIEAAKHNLGVGLVPTELVKKELSSGTLIEPIQTTKPSLQGYYLCTKKSKIGMLKVKIFTDWIKQISRNIDSV